MNELRYQGERRGWDAPETDARVRGGLTDLYAGTAEAAIGQDDLDGAAALYEHARPVLDPERQAAIDRRFMRAREVALYRDVDRDLAGLLLGPAAPPVLDMFERLGRRSGRRYAGKAAGDSQGLARGDVGQGRWDHLHQPQQRCRSPWHGHPSRRR